MSEILQGGPRDTIGQDTSGTITTHFTVTNLTEDLSLNCNEGFAEAGFLALQDNVGTLIRELIKKGILNGTVA